MFDIHESKKELKFDDLCRLCAKYDSVKINVFSDEGKRRELQRKIQSCLPFKVDENDGLPNSLCFKCVYNLENSYEFRDRCIQVNKNLEKHLHKTESPEKHSSNSNTPRRIRPEVSIFAIPPIHTHVKEEDEASSICADGDDIPNPFDYLKVDVNADDSAPENSSVARSKSNAGKQYVWNANKRWLSMEHRPLNSDQKDDSSVITKAEPTQDDSSLNRRKNNNPRKIARDTEDEPHPLNVSSSANGTSIPALGLLTLQNKYNQNADKEERDRHNPLTKLTLPSVIEDAKENTEKPKTFSCLLCEQNFSQRSALNKHFSSIHGIEPYEVMSQTPLLSQSLRQYTEDNKNDEDFAESMMEQETVIFCEVCRREFQDRASLWLHMVHAHREEASVSCGICLKICCDNITLIEHVNTAHSGDKAVIQRRYSCQVCGRQHDSRQKLLKHATLHTLIDNQGQTIQPEEMISLNNAFAPRECPICHKKFFNEEKLNSHTQNFHNDGHDTSTTLAMAMAINASATMSMSMSPSVVYKCELCASTHANRMDRWWHVYHSHNGDHRVTCDFGRCRKIFVTQSLRDEHTKTHHEAQGDFTNTCEICGKLWESRTVFYKHMMNVHPKCLPTICGVCMKIFSNVPELRGHVQTEHSTATTDGTVAATAVAASASICCDVCGRPYGERSKMLRHRRVHNVTDGVPITVSMVKRKDDLICSVCPELTFENFEEIADHRRSVHQLFVCDLCPKFYNGNNHLWKHVSKQHKGDPNVTCNLCLRTSASRAHLERHKIKYHSDPVSKLVNSRPPTNVIPEIHKCDLCGRVFRIRSLLKKHQKSCKGLKPVTPKMVPVNGVFPCSKCSKVFAAESVLSKHMRNSHVVHYCEACDAEAKVGFDSKIALLDHIRAAHPNDPELVCDVETCRKVVRMKADLQKHKQEHIRGYFTYFCDMCGDMFSNRKKLRKHLLTYHKSHVQFLCAICVAILSSYDELIEHVNKNHRISLYRPFTCQICGKCCPSASKVVDHIGNAHGKQYKPCRTCWKVFTDEKELEKHVQNHPPAEERPHAQVRREPRVRPDTSILEDESTDVSSFEQVTDNKRNAAAAAIDDDDDLHSFELSGGKRLRKMYSCAACKETFRSISELKEHKLQMHGTSRLSESELFAEGAAAALTTATTSAAATTAAAAAVTTATTVGTNSFAADSVDPRTERWTDFRPIECDCCGKTWNSKKQLWQHLIRSHPFQSMHTCGICLQVCRNYTDLWYHLDAQHPFILNDPGGRFACYVCGHYHNSQSKLDKHIGVHKEPPLPAEYRCQYCQKVYRSIEYYRKHVRGHETSQPTANAATPKKKESSEFVGFSIDSILSTGSTAATAAAAAAVAATVAENAFAEDDITEVDENDVEKTEYDDDLVELEEDEENSDSENDSNSSVKDLMCEDNVFRGYENEEYAEDADKEAAVRRGEGRCSSEPKMSQLVAASAVAAAANNVEQRTMPTLTKIKIDDHEEEDDEEDDEVEDEEDEEEVEEEEEMEGEIASPLPANSVDVDMESDISYSSVENSPLPGDDDMVYNGQPEPSRSSNVSIPGAYRAAVVNNNQKPERMILESKQNFRNSNGDDYFRRMKDGS